jgi:allantoinase
VHILHVSSAAVLDVLAAAKADGVRITAETCPHYLFFAAGEVPAGGTQFKCCPPIRGAANRERLWAGLAAGVLDMVVSDHSPSPAALKAGGFDTAWGGISSVQVAASALWSRARVRGHTLADLGRWLGSGPAALAGLAHKGALRPGADADAAVFAPGETFVVDPARLHHRHPVTPYAGATLHGVVRATWLRGSIVDGPRGRLLERA